MKGPQAWDCKGFHDTCEGVIPVDVGGFKYLWCPRCRTLANLEAVSPKHTKVEDAGIERKDVPVRVK